MNKLICVATILFMAAAVMAQPTIVYLNSKTATCTSYGKTSECLQYKHKQTDTAWSNYNGGTIKGFTYNPGYFYTLQVRQLAGNRKQWGLVKLISKTKSTVQQLASDSIAAAKPPAPLIGQWKFSRLIAGTKETELGANNETLQFDAINLKINGKASCNRFFADYTIADAGQIKFESIGSTRMACETIATETIMLKALEMVDSWNITGNKLELKSGGTTIIELIKTIPSISPNG